MRFLKLLISYAFVSLMIFECGEGAIDYGSLINQVNDKYGTGGIIIASTINHESIENMTYFHRISSEMSAKGIASVIVNFIQLKRTVEFYRGKIVRPLVVILIDEINEIYEFNERIVDMDMSYPVWLVLFTGDENEDTCRYCYEPIGNPFNLKFNSEMLVSCCNSGYIDDFWSQTINQTNKLSLGRWIDENNGIKWYPHGSVYSRRKFVGNSEIRIATVKGSGYIWREDDQFVGFFGEVFTELSRDMNLTVSSVIEESSFGGWDERASQWTGGVGALLQGKADIGVSEFTMNNQRLEVVDFTLPIILGKWRLYIKKPDGVDVQWDAYVKAFHPDIWLVMCILLLTIPILLTIIKYKKKENLFAMICEHYLNVWGIFCQQGLSDFPDEAPLRIVYTSIFISAIVAYAAYSASLISHLTTSSLDLPFHTMEEFANHGTYKLTTLRDSSDYDLFKMSNDTVLKKMMKLMKSTKFLPRSLEEGFRQVCNEKVAFFTTEALRQRVKRHILCDIVHLETGRIGNMAMILPLNSEYTGYVNHHIHRFRSNGILERLNYKYFMKSTPAENYHKPVTLRSIIPILTILAAGSLISLVIFSIERIIYHSNIEFLTQSRKHKLIQQKARENVNFSHKLRFWNT